MSISSPTLYLLEKPQPEKVKAEVTEFEDSRKAETNTRYAIYNFKTKEKVGKRLNMSRCTLKYQTHIL